MVWCGAVWYGAVCGMVWYGMVWHGMAWCGTVRYGTDGYGMVWYGMVCVGLRYNAVSLPTKRPPLRDGMALPYNTIISYLLLWPNVCLLTLHLLC